MSKAIDKPCNTVKKIWQNSDITKNSPPKYDWKTRRRLVR